MEKAEEAAELMRPLFFTAPLSRKGTKEMKNGSSSEKYRQQIMWGEPILDEKTGIVFYPITMQDYEMYQLCKSALLIRQSTLPASYIAMPYLQALYAYDIETGYANGLMLKVLNILAMAMQRPLECLKVFVNPNGEFAEIRYQSSSEIMRITAKDFAKIRSTIAEQNGDKLPDESENTELVEAENDIALKTASKVEYSFETLISSVALQYRIRPKEILQWNIREFENVKRAIERDKLYMLCTAAEFGGTKWKNGNPAPSWFADRKREGSIALEPLKDLAARLGIK